MNEKRILPTSKFHTGVIESCGKASFYDEALVTFNVKNEVRSSPTVETYNSLIYAFAKGGLYKEAEVIFSRMGESGVAWDRDLFNGMIEAYRQAGRDAIKTYVEMNQVRCNPDERTLEAVRSVYCLAGLVERAKSNLRG
ncbi:hypothetical protein MLD38_026156 [Melastoma candidum]|uniref:Uncharacterized protein n=1 Tax=Melastoma candidum TaxID=119954 RepID=A0ACB9NYL6_9MYRT|nr:hypothetical protein MLD38_026156 [Melastoma candidum]